MAGNTIARQKNINWTRILYVIGILGIVFAVLFLYSVIRDTDALTHDPLQDSIPQLTPEQVRERIEQRNQIILLDVRTTMEWDTTPHAEGAVSMPLTDVYGNAVDALDPNAEIIVMCYSGNTRSMKAAAWLQQHGFENISNLDGGLEAWQEANLPTETASLSEDEADETIEDKGSSYADTNHAASDN